MKFAILADIHANLEALEAVLLAAEDEGADRFIALGDVVGYGVDPVACLYRLREQEFSSVLGNHDQALVDCKQARSLNAIARDTVLRSRHLVSEEHLDYIRHFGFRHVEYDAVFSHANPIKPEEWLHMILFPDIAWCLDRLDWKIAFVGHTHHPAIYCKTENRITALTSSEVAVGRHRFMINPGSVGQPRDGDRRASYALWDVAADYVQLRRVEYPVERTQQKIAEAGWPDYVAERLGRGE